MPQQHPPPLDDSRLHALVDGQLAPQEAERLRAQLDDAQRETLQAWARQREQLKSLHADWLQHPIPGEMQRSAELLASLQARRRSRTAWVGMAASWLLAFGLGWGLHAPGTAPESPVAATQPQRFVQQAAVAHAVFEPEQRHPVEVGAAQQEHLVQWLSKRLGHPLKAPQLQAQGYELMGGRLLPGEQGARAQFMYQDAAGGRITLYVGAMHDTQAARQTAFQFSQEGEVSSFYWTDQGLGYALSGELPRPALQTLATAVYQQLARADSPAPSH